MIITLIEMCLYSLIAAQTGFSTLPTATHGHSAQQLLSMDVMQQSMMRQTHGFKLTATWDCGAQLLGTLAMVRVPCMHAATV